MLSVLFIHSIHCFYMCVLIRARNSLNVSHRPAAAPPGTRAAATATDLEISIKTTHGGVRGGSQLPAKVY